MIPREMVVFINPDGTGTVETLPKGRSVHTQGVAAIGGESGRMAVADIVLLVSQNKDYTVGVATIKSRFGSVHMGSMVLR